jgi:hypothetical protein
MNTLFTEYNDDEELKQILRVGSLGLFKIKKKVTKRGITNERQAALKEIQEIMEQENGAPMSKEQKKVFAMKLAHVPTEDLYFMKSEGISYRRKYNKPFGKYIYGSVKVKLDKPI